MYIIGYYDTKEEKNIFHDKSFFSESEAISEMEDLFERITQRDINIENIINQPISILDDLYQILVSKDATGITTIKLYIRSVSKGYIYNTFTPFKLQYSFFITSVPDSNEMTYSIKVSESIPVIQTSPIPETRPVDECREDQPSEEDIQAKLMVELKQKLVFRCDDLAESRAEPEDDHSEDERHDDTLKFIGGDMSYEDENNKFIRSYLRRRRKRIRYRKNRV
jgi:hypothetical protein